MRLPARSLPKGRKEVGTEERRPVDTGADDPPTGIEGPARGGAVAAGPEPGPPKSITRRNTRMVQLLWLARDKVLNFLHDTRAQDTFEYVLIIGAITVAIIGAVVLATPNLIDGVVGGVCAAINTILDPDIACS